MPLLFHKYLLWNLFELMDIVWLGTSISSPLEVRRNFFSSFFQEKYLFSFFLKTLEYCIQSWNTIETILFVLLSTTSPSLNRTQSALGDNHTATSSIYFNYIVLCLIRIIRRTVRTRNLSH